jgi:hypothetical protein
VAPTAQSDTRVQGDQRDRKVGGVGRDATVAGAEYGVQAVFSADGGASRALLALIARQLGVAKIGTASALKKVSSNRGNIADLR